MDGLFATARLADTCECYDSYSSTLSFLGQLAAFEQGAPDGSTSKRRTMSVSPTTTIPTRRAITFLGETWLVGDGLVDEYKGRAIRTNYWVKKATGLAIVRTPAQLLSGVGGVSAYTSQTYLKSTVEVITTTDYAPFFEFFFSTSESILRGQFLTMPDSKLYRVREVHWEQAGFLNAQADELVGVTVSTLGLSAGGVYDPITDTMTGGTSTVSAVLVDSSKFYTYISEDAPLADRSDKTALTLAPLLPNQAVTASGVQYHVMSCQPELDAYLSLLRRA